MINDALEIEDRKYIVTGKIGEGGAGIVYLVN